MKPIRMTDNRATYRDRWWQYAEKRKELYSAISSLERVLVVSRVGQHAAFTFLPNRIVFAESVVTFPLHTYPAFCILQCRIHEIWARFFGSSMKDDLRYTPSDCFDAFPFPQNWEAHETLESAGKMYFEYRAALMVDSAKGMTTTYNRFHDIYETDSGIVDLRELHTAMDRAVLGSYGWTDITTDCEYLLDYEIDETTWGRKKKPYRYRWPDAVRDEVLARLLALNAERAQDDERTPAECRTSPRGADRTQFGRAPTPVSMNSDVSGSHELDAIMEPHE